MDIPRARPARRHRGAAAALLAAAIALALAVGASARLRRAAPTIAASAIVLAKVDEGTFRREVRGSGRLVPEEVRWVTAVTAGRVERILLRPGAQVEADTVLLQLSNPDVVVALLQAERELATARRQALELESRLQTQRLTDEGAVATLEAETHDADGRLKVYKVQEGLIVGGLEVRQTEARAAELHKRLSLTQQRVAMLSATLKQAAEVHRDETRRREEEVAFRRSQVEALAVRAGAAGLLADVPVEPGQWAAPGAVLAQVVRPERLKAEIRVPEALAKDVVSGQPVTVDTHAGTVVGSVRRVASNAKDGTVVVEVALPDELPPGARPQLNVEGLVEVETIPSTLFVERPAFARAEATAPVFRVEAGGKSAERVLVTFGRVSSRSIEVRSGLRPGDRIVVSDTSAFDEHSRIQLSGEP